MSARKERRCQMCGKPPPPNRKTCSKECWLKRCKQSGAIRHEKRIFGIDVAETGDSSAVVTAHLASGKVFVDGVEVFHADPRRTRLVKRLRDMEITPDEFLREMRALSRAEPARDHFPDGEREAPLALPALRDGRDGGDGP